MVNNQETPEEIGKYLKEILDKHPGMSIQKLAYLLGRHGSWVYEHLKLTETDKLNKS